MRPPCRRAGPRNGGRRGPAAYLVLLLTCIAAPSAAANTTLSAAAWPALRNAIDRVVGGQLVFHDIPGAAVALVGNGEIRHLQGYGLADLEARTPVDAGRTLFGTGSVSKLLTWTAVMQLVREDALALDRDINDYLQAAAIPANGFPPVTLAHLLTHTAGFEERIFGFYARDAADVLPLPRFLAGQRPARVYPPGTVSAYSNYGAALAGQVVARAAGMSFEDYVETRVLEPLGMTRSSFRQPLPPALAADLATGYRGQNGRTGHGWYQAGPSAALRTTAADMARFLLAHLEAGRTGEARRPAPAGLAAMHARHFANHPAVSGLTYGFQELHRGGRRILWQPGDTLFYTAALFLLPDANLGLFVAYNRAGAGPARLEVLDTVLATLPPGGGPPASPAGEAPRAPVPGPAGEYRRTRSGVTGLERLIEPFHRARVREAAAGTLAIRGLSLVKEAVWIEQAPGVYRDRDSEEIVVFHEDAASGTMWLYEGNVPVFAYYRLPWYATLPVQAALLAGCALVFLAGLVFASAQGTRQLRAGAAATAGVARLTLPVTGLLCLVNLVFLAGLYAVVDRAWQLLFGIPPFARAVLLLPGLSAVLTLAATFLVLRAWRGRGGARTGRLPATLVMVAGLVFLGMLRYWRLL